LLYGLGQDVDPPTILVGKSSQKAAVTEPDFEDRSVDVNQALHGCRDILLKKATRPGKSRRSSDQIEEVRPPPGIEARWFGRRCPHLFSFEAPIQ
jgi:hypothetical protein